MSIHSITTKLKKKTFNLLVLFVLTFTKAVKWFILFYFALFIIGIGCGAGYIGVRVIHDIYGPSGSITCLLFAYIIGGISIAVGNKFFATTKEAAIHERIC